MISGQDLRLEMVTAETEFDSVSFSPTAERVQLIGGRVQDGFGASGGTDIHIENVNAYDSGGIGWNNTTRLTIMNSTLTSGEYINTNAAGAEMRDTIFVGNDFAAQTNDNCAPVCNASTVMKDIHSALFGYNCLKNRLDEAQRTWRFRGPNSNILLLKNILIGRHSGNAVGGMLENVGGSSGDLTNIRYDGNHTWDDRPVNQSFMQLDQDSVVFVMTGIRFANNVIHSGGAGTWSLMVNPPAGTLEYDDSDGNSYINEGAEFSYPACPYGAAH